MAKKKATKKKSARKKVTATKTKSVKKKTAVKRMTKESDESFLPKCEEKILLATFERAHAHQEDEYTYAILKKMQKDNRELLEALCIRLDGFNLDERSTLTAMTMMCLMYDALNTQGEADGQ